MTGSRFSRWAGFRAVIACLLVAQWIWFEASVLRGLRFSEAPGGRLSAIVLVAIVYGAALASLFLSRSARIRILALAAALLLTARFYTPVARLRWANRLGKSATEREAALVSYLRQLEAAQEQYRLLHASYSSSADSLSWWAPPLLGTSLRITKHSNKGWAAQITSEHTACSVWVRDSALVRQPSQPEGVPHCGAARSSAPNRIEGPDNATVERVERPFQPADLVESWSQHRADAARSGLVPLGEEGAPQYRWTARVFGELRASVAVAGNQVFVGAHGNGEFVGLSLKSGATGFRVRAPNWIHHEPIIAGDLVVVAFGNNEKSLVPGVLTGSPPSGVAAYDRRTGVERWQHFTTGSAMSSPVAWGSLIAVVTGGSEAIAWKLANGTQVWRALLPGPSPMGNPLLLDTLMIVGLEPTTICALDVRNGRRVYCRSVSDRGWGAGHASPAGTSTVLLQVFDQGVSLFDAIGAGRWRYALKQLLGVPDLRARKAKPEELGEQVLVALDPATGRERWRLSLGIGDKRIEGHIAGTPVVVGSTAYVTSPINGAVTAVRLVSGVRLWAATVNAARGSVLVTRGAVLAATLDSSLVVLDAATGRARCKERLPGLSDRAGITLAGQTGILTLRNGLVVARPITDWLACTA